jgi:hypothetical protein
MVKDVHEIEVEDENRLADLGYKQELAREWSVIHNFGVSFSIIVSCLLLHVVTIDGGGSELVNELMRFCADMHF